MDAERWRQLRTLFDAARQMSEDQRSRFLASACDGDVDLREEVLSLLNRDDRPADPIAKVVERAAEQVATGAVLAPTPSLAPGQILGRYEVLEQLGAGGMGEVWLARDRELDRQVALKTVGKSLAPNSQLLTRFRQEARALAALDHPHIVTIYSVEEVDETTFLTMERVDGSTLAEQIPDRGFGIDRLLGVALPLAQAVSAVHEAGIVHRDLKPTNLMVDGSGQLKVLDFGLAKVQYESESRAPASDQPASTTLSGMAMGTIPYMSPEQIEGKSVDARSDVFSLGVVLYEMATGERPFTGDSPESLMSSILEERPQRPDAIRPDLPRGVGNVIMRCLRKNPDERWDNAQALHQELSTLVERRTRSSPGTTGIRTAAAIFALLATGVAVWVDRDQELPATESPAPPRISSLAVLPFVSHSDDPAQDFLAGGMTEMLISELAKVESLKVISRTSAMRFAASDLDVPEIAHQLNVEGVIEGSVARIDNRVRVLVSLVDVAADQAIWGESYEGSFGDLLGLQERVARAVAVELEVHLAVDEAPPLQGRDAISAEAVQAHLEARHLLSLVDPASADEALEKARRVTELEPEFADGWATLADAHAWAGNLRRTSDSYPQAELAARRALELDPDLAEGHMVLAWAALNHDWDWPAAEYHARRAVALLPGASLPHQALATALVIHGDFDPAIAEGYRALELDPLSPLASGVLCEVLYLARRYEEAFERCRAGLELHPGHPWLLNLLGGLHKAQGDDDQWVETDLQKLRRVHPARARTLEETYHQRGFRGYVEEIAHGLRQAVDDGELAAVDLAAAYVFLGDREEALQVLDEGPIGMPMGPKLGLDPIWDPLRGDPRFEAILDRLQFPFRVSPSQFRPARPSVEESRTPLSPSG